MKKRKNIVIVTGIYLLSFIVAIVLFSYVLNYSSTHPARSQGATSLTRLYVKSGGMLINEMDGFAREMSQGYLRISVTPVSDNQTVIFKVDEQENAVQEITYELYDDSGEEQLETGMCDPVQRVEGEKQTQLRLEMPLSMGREYCLKLILKDDSDKEYYYYTRLVNGTDVLAYDKVQFALDFHTATFQKSSADKISDYLEDYEKSSNLDFRKVDIHSGSDMVTWGLTDPVATDTPSITIKSLDKQTAQIQLVYPMTINDDEGKGYNYTVTEVYDVASSGSEMYLNDYTRTMEEKLERTSFTFSNDQLRVGMVSDSRLDLHVFGRQMPEETEETQAQETGTETVAENAADYNTYIGFVGDGVLWVYNTTDNILTQAFSFEGDTPSEERALNYQRHGIRILRTEDNGDVYFALYGYIYNGDAEGQVGIQVNKFTMKDNTSAEVLFIPYDKSFEMLRQDVETMAFMDGDGQFYLCLEDTIYKFDVYLKKSEAVFEQVKASGCSISEDGRSIVYGESRDENGLSTKLIWMNLEIGSSLAVDGGGRKMTQIGFLGEDYVYGIYSEDGSRIVKLNIIDESLNVVKEYSVENGYISDTELSDGILTIQRKKNNNESMEADYILRHEQAGNTVTKVTVSAGNRLLETAISTGEFGYQTPIVQSARVIASYRDTAMDFDLNIGEFKGYYVYNREELQKYDAFSSAYKAALNGGGKVLNSMGKTICRPDSISSVDLDGYSISQADTQEGQMKAVLQWLMTYESLSGEPVVDTDNMMEAMAKNLPSVHVVDMTGIGLDEALAMISAGYPLVVKNSEGRFCVAEGYKNGYIVLADPGDGTVSGYEEAYAIQGIASSGNIIYSYYR